MAQLQLYLRKVGIDAKLEFYDAGKYIYALTRGFKNGIMIFAQGYRKNQTDELNGLFKKGATRFPNLFRPPELEEALTKAEREQDYETQAALTRKAVRIISDEAIALPLWTYPGIYIMNKKFRNPGFNYGQRGQWFPGGAWLSE